MATRLTTAHTDKAGQYVVLVNEGEQQPDPPPWPPERMFFVSGDYTRVDVLQQAGIERAAIAILLADKTLPRADQDRDARTVLAALTIERLNQDIFTCVELLHRENQTHLSLAGVEEIVVPDEYAGKILATASRNRGVVAVLDELLTSDLGNNIYKASAPVEWFGKDVGWVMQRLKGEHDALFISLERSGSKGDKPRVLVNPPLQEKVEKGDYLIFLARSLPGSLN